MPLTPKRPPGRSTRKARAFEADIAQLRAQGYTLEAIREALAEAGVHVGKSTVQREAARSTPGRQAKAVEVVTAGADRIAAPPHAPTGVETPVAPVSASSRAELRSGKDIAEAFVRNRITNPLVRTRSSHENSRH